MVQILIKCYYILKSGGHFVQLVQFDRGQYGEHFCKIILNLDGRFPERCLKKMFTDKE